MAVKLAVKNKNPLIVSAGFAEREGFEPPAPLSAAVFKTAVIDHSTISPWGMRDTAVAAEPESNRLQR